MKLLLRHPHPAIHELLENFHLDRAAIQESIVSVLDHRNPAAHGDSFDTGAAEAIRADWFHWRGRHGGIFSVFFTND
jgi:hypothetical protein